MLTSEKRLELNAEDAAICGVPKLETTDVDDANATNEELQFAVGLADVVEAHALSDGRARAGGPVE